MVQFKFKYDDCIRCKKCIKACFVDVLRWDEENNRPVAKYPEECAVCTWCIIECPRDVIDVIPDYSMKRPPVFPKEKYPLSYEEAEELF